MPSLNWNQIRKDIRQYTDLKKLKSELTQLKSEIKKLNVHTFLSPAASQRLKKLEIHYSDVRKSMHRTQRQLDREVNRFLRKFKTTRMDAEKRFEGLYNLAVATTHELKSRVLHEQKQPTKKRRQKNTIAKKATKKKRHA